MPNTELFKQINEVISTRPKEHDQATYESWQSCGTTRCVAGWAISLTTGTPVFDGTLRITLHPEVAALEERLGVQRDVGEDDVDVVPAIAQELLGLTDQQAHQLFYTFNQDTAQRLVREYAEAES